MEYTRYSTSVTYRRLFVKSHRNDFYILELSEWLSELKTLKVNFILLFYPKCFSKIVFVWLFFYVKKALTLSSYTVKQKINNPTLLQ